MTLYQIAVWKTNFLTWLLIGWQHSRQQIRSHIRIWPSTSSDAYRKRLVTPTLRQLGHSVYKESRAVEIQRQWPKHMWNDVKYCHFSTICTKTLHHYWRSNLLWVTFIGYILPNHLLRHISKETLKFCVTGPCEGNPPVTGGFPSQMASNAANVSIRWRHHEFYPRHFGTSTGNSHTANGATQSRNELSCAIWSENISLYS